MATDTAEPQAKRVKIDGPAVADSNECINFHLLKKVDGTVTLEEGGTFHPDMSHQLFGEDEQIRGFQDPQIDVFYTPAFQTMIQISFDGEPESGATDLAKPLTETFSAGFFKTKDEFDAAFGAEAPLRVADLGAELISADSSGGAKIKILHTNLAAAPEALRAIHARLQPLLLFFVDAASGIDASDPAWDLLLAVEAAPDGTATVLGFATLYNFWVFPDRRRVRISQVLVLPPHQGRGVGALLVKAAYQVADTANAVDITLEDPTDDMQRIRDRMDLARMLQFEWMQEEALARLKTALSGGDASTAAGASPLVPTPECVTKMRAEMRMSRQQAVRMWEAMLYAVAAPQGGAATAAVEGFMQASIEALVAGAKKGSEGKKLTDTESGFVMVKTKKEGSAAALAAPGAVPVEGVSMEQQREAIREAVQQRVAEIRKLLGLKSGDGEDADDGEEAEADDA